MAARLGVFEARLGVLERLGGQTGRLGMSLAVLGTRFGDVPMRFYKVIDVKKGPRGGVTAKNHCTPIKFQ